MRTWPLVLVGLGACGPIYPDQQPARQPMPEPAQASGPPGGGGAPADDPWAPEEPAAVSPAPATPARPGGPAAQPDDPYAARPDDPYAARPNGPGSQPRDQRPARPEPPRTAEPPARPEPPRTAEPPRTPGLSADAQALLDEHNRVRAQHCAPPLRWSPALAQVAQQWANSLRDEGCKFGHSGGRYGENLAAGTSGTLDGRSVTGMWYDEIKLYTFPNGGFSMQTGHFTQVVWKQSTQLGCAVSTCRGMDIWVCEYDPPGNVQGMYRQNVLPTGCK